MTKNRWREVSEKTGMTNDESKLEQRDLFYCLQSFNLFHRHHQQCLLKERYAHLAVSSVMHTADMLRLSLVKPLSLGKLVCPFPPSAMEKKKADS